jgi:hypothetical protein
MKGYILSQQETLFGHIEPIGFGKSDFNVTEVSRDLANRVVMENHYSKKHDSIAHNKINLGVNKDGVLKGILQFGYAMNPASCASVVSGTGLDEYLELNRMWLHDDCERNSESMAISYAIKYIKKKYPKIKWIQSFADERCGKNGIVYQAANFGFYGDHVSVFWELDGEFYHNSIMTNAARTKAVGLQSRMREATKHELRQFRYLFFIRHASKKDCLLEQQPYPKHYEDEQ